MKIHVVFLIVIPQCLFAQEKDSLQSTLLKEVTIYPFSNNIKKDVQNMKFKESYEDKFHLPTASFKKDSANSFKKYPSLGNSMLGLNPLGIIGNLNGYYKKERTLFDFEYNQSLSLAMLEIVGNSFFVQDLQMKEEQIFEFISYSIKTNKSLLEPLILAKNKLELMAELEKLYKQYPKN